MADFSLVKKLRAETGAGIDICNSALTAANNDYDKAIEILKEKGLEKAAKKINNETKNGSVIIKSDGSKVAILNFKAETDFAVNSEGFCNFISQEIDALFNSSESDINNLMIDGVAFKDRLSFFASTLGENLKLNACQIFKSTDSSYYVTYCHKKIRAEEKYSNIASLVVVVRVSENTPKDIANNIAAHIAACDSMILSKNDITNELRETYPNIEDLILLNQEYFYDNTFTIESLCNKYNIEILEFKTFLA